MKRILAFLVFLSIIGLSDVLAQAEKIYFSMGNEAYSNYSIYSINPDGTGLRPIIQWAGCATRNPRISPDGKKIAFVSNKNSINMTAFQVWVANVDGSDPVQLTNSLIGTNWGITWHPNGQYIYYGDAAAENDVRICKIKVDSTGFQVVIDHSGSCNNDCGPDINPADSNRILYQFDHCWNPTSNEYVYNLQLQTEVQILDGTSLDAAHGCFHWSPDGTKIVLFIGINSGWVTHSWALNVMNTDGSNLHSITTITGTEGYYYSDWSPDGSKIASTYFESDPDAAHYLYMMNNDGSNPTQIYYNDTADINWVDWGVINNVGINENKPERVFSIYPNPADDHITIENETSNSKDEIISIYNIQGQLILQKPILDVMINIDISMLSKGMYIVEILSDQKIGVKKFIKE